MNDAAPHGTRGAEGGARPPSLFRAADIAIAAVLLLICAFLYWQTISFETPPSMLDDYMLPQEFPRLLIWTIVVLSLLLPLEHMKLVRSGAAPKNPGERTQAIAYVTTAFMFAMVLAVPRLGTMVTVVLICALMPLLWGERRYRIVAAFAILFPAAVYVLFELLFQVRLIPGLLRPLYY